jgi:hypothetical protein
VDHEALEDIHADIPTPEHELYEDDDVSVQGADPDIDNVTPEMQDGYIGAQVNLPHGGSYRSGTVKRRKRNNDGELEGVADKNPIRDTRTYEVEFDDGELVAYSANLIAENMYAQCDIDGNQYRLMDDLVDHRTTEAAVKFADRFVTVRGRQHMRKTTVGWSLCVLRKNGETSWMSLADLKESNPLEVAEYAVSQGIDHEPAFSWWVPNVLKKRDRIISAVSKRYLKRTHKFGIEVPKSVADAMRLDTENGNTLWMDAVALEIDSVGISWTTSIDECKWLDVVCDDDGRVVALLLDEKNVLGQIPNDLGLLTDLTSLQLFDNRLTGTIPSSLGLMTALVDLDLRDNTLTGTIPSSIGDLKALTILQFWSNQLRGTIPPSFGALTALSFLGMSDNELTGTIPSSFDALTALTQLYLNNNQLVGTMPFCNSTQAFEYLIADCAALNCTCCTHCCPTAFGDIPVSGGCV